MTMGAWWWMHPLAVVVWMGGASAIALVAWAGAKGERPEVVASAARVALRALVVPALLLAWGAGLARLLPAFSEHYARSGWMHAKLTLALVASGATGMLGATLRRAAEGEGSQQGRLRVLFLVHLFLAAAVLWLVSARPF